MTDTAVRFENLSKFYKLYYSPKDRLKEALSPFGKKRHREFYALKNINLDIKKGEILGVVGRNGSGKSTLLGIISGFIQPNAGTKMVTGRLSALLDLGFGMNPDFDGFQNIYFGGIMLGFSKQEMKGKIDEIIAFADIGEFIQQPMKTYSAGMKARLGFALAISVNPDILIVDEVLAVGDDLFRRKCFSKMEEIIAKGCTIIYVSHAINTVNELCSRAILLDRGELILDGPPKWVTANYQKLIFALPDSQEKIRGQLLAMNENNAPQPACQAPYLPADPPAIPESKSFFIPGFTSQSAIVVKNGAVDIFDIQLKNPAGQAVNAVVMHEKLIYSYKVKFNADAHGIIFSMAIKNEKGLNISARKTGELVGPNEYGTILREVKAGSCCEVQWEFVNTLLPGVYFTNAAVFKVIPGEDTHVLIRITDALVFKVQDTRDPLMNGIVDLHQEFNIRLTGT